MLVYEMLCGYPPFYDDSPYGIYQKILAGKIDFPKLFNKEGRPQWCKDFIRKLCNVDKYKRLGCTQRGPDEVKLHKWFRGVNWVVVEEKKLPTPWAPKLETEFDTQCFDKYPDSNDKVPDIEDTEFEEF